MNFSQSRFPDPEEHGGGQEVEPDHRDFVNRYEQGLPHEGYSDEEVLRHHQHVSRQIPSDLYHESAQEAFARMSPKERLEFGRLLQQELRQQNFNFPDLDQDGQDDRLQDPNYLARVTGRMHQHQPDLLGQVMSNPARRRTGGSSGADALNSPLAREGMRAVAGIAVTAIKMMMAGGRHGNIGFASQGSYPASGWSGNIRPASQDPYGDPADR